MQAFGTFVLSTVSLTAVVAGCAEDGGPSPGARSDRDSSPQRTVTVDIGRGPERTRGRRAPNVPGDDACEGARRPASAGNLRRAEIAIRCVTNAARRKNGLPQLRFDERLARAAANRSAAMAEANFFGHGGPGDSSVRSAARAVGWVPQGKSWLLGENIGWAAGPVTPARMMRGWLDSARHRENILAGHFTHTGVGAVAAVPKKGARAGATFTQIFGVTGPEARRAQTR